MSDTTLNSFIGRGTTAERTAFVPSPPTPASGPDQGYLWWDTDTEQEYAYDFVAVAWKPVATAAGTVTNVAGSLTDHALVVGNSGADIDVLSSLGTTTTAVSYTHLT